ncbi:MAG: amidohydrolase family protein [Christensenellales bacterium]|jgi:5-methylthioadenosine/S-adenosylhomocysteine deaminase
MRTLIKNARVLTMDDVFTVHENGCVLVEDDLIAYAGAQEDCPSGKAQHTIDAAGGIVMPGLCNMHTHVSMTYVRGIVNDRPLATWLARILEIEALLEEEDVYWGAMMGIAEMLSGGTTLLSDMYGMTAQIARAAFDTGIRAAVADGFIGGQENADQLERTRALYERFNGERIKVLVGLHAEYSTDSWMVRHAAELARELGTGIHVHVSETTREVDECIERHGMTPPAYLEKHGLFSAGQTVAAHCVDMRQGDIEILAANGVSAAHNPGSNSILASGLSPILQMAEKGVNVCIGTDGAASNNNLDMLQETYLASMLQKLFSRDAQALPARLALEMATKNGPKALGWQHMTGMLKAGMKADLCIVGTDKPAYLPKTDPAVSLVFAGNAADVRLTMVDGRVLYENGEYRTLDYDEVKREFLRIVDKLHKKAGI